MPIRIGALPAELVYEGIDRLARWEGYIVANHEAFKTFLSGPVAARAMDSQVQQPFENELHALATTGMATEFLERFLAAVPEKQSSEVGEALAETLLMEDENREVMFPWNELRDRRTPQASLPGADLVGFCRDDRGCALLFGEVKTSGDAAVPPRVMTGRSGMTWQLETNATELNVQNTLLRWLRTRCQTQELVAAYRGAIARYLKSAGKDVVIVGVLLRDTDADERDVRKRAIHLAGQLHPPTKIEVVAWYLPEPIESWPKLIRCIS